MNRWLRSTVLTLMFALLTMSVAQAQDTVTVTGKVTTAADGLALPGATVTIPALKLSAETGEDGTYSITVPASDARGQTVEVKVIYFGLQTQSANVVLSGNAPIVRDFGLVFGFHEEITVGSRLAGAAAEKAVPVDILTPHQIATSGASETNQIIQALTPSFNFPRPTITDGTDSVRPATLRGLGPDQVLVLINGKRRHIGALVHVNGSIGRGSTGVDLNAIPASAIQRIEILRDGAAAQYGSDAIAGVINIVLKAGVSPTTLNAKAGITTHDDGGLFDVSANRGWNIGRGAVFATIEFRDRGETNRAGVDPRDQIVVGDAGNNSVAQPNFHWGDADTTDLMTFANAEFPISTGTTSFYAFGGISRRQGVARRILSARNGCDQLAADLSAGISSADRTGHRRLVGHRRPARHPIGMVLGRQRAVRLQQLRFQRYRQPQRFPGADQHPAGVLLGIAGVRPVPHQLRCFAPGRCGFVGPAECCPRCGVPARELPDHRRRAELVH